MGSWKYRPTGIGEYGDFSVPLPLDLTGITAIAGGSATGYALQSNGTVWAWGWNRYGQLGSGTSSDHDDFPEQVSGLSGVASIAGGGNAGYALRSDGTVSSWGENTFGQLGDGRPR